MKNIFLILFLLSSLTSALTSQDFKIDKITISIDGIASPIQLRKWLLFGKGDVINTNDIQKQIDVFNNKAFYKSISWSIIDKNPETSILHFDFVVDTGNKPVIEEQMYIDRILISGNWKTLDSVLLKEMLFRDKSAVTTNEIRASVQRIRNLDYFYQLDWGLIYTDEETVLQILVSEKWTTFPVIYIEGDDQVTEVELGAVDLNLLGLGLFLKIDYTGYFSDSPLKSNFNIEASYNNISGSEIDIQTEFGLNDNLHEISNQGIIDAGFNHNKIRFIVEGKYHWGTHFIPGLGLEFSRNSYSGDDVNIAYNTPYMYSSTMFSPEFSLAYSNLNLVDHRKKGFFSKISYAPQIPLSGDELLYHKISMEIQYHQIFPVNWIFLRVKAMFDFSTSDKATGYENLSAYLRGGSGKTIYDPFSTGFTLEAGFTPLNLIYFTLDIKAIADFSWSGSSVYWRLGPGINLTFPFIAELNISVDLIWTEKGNLELFFGMLPFFR